MKKYIVLSLAVILFAGKSVLAQDESNFVKHTNIQDKDKDVVITLGTRFTTDAAYLNSDFSDMKSGAKISEFRVRTSLAYKKWFFYGDFDFGEGKFTQKDLYVKYQFTDADNNAQSLKIGYYAEPFSMSLNTSMGSMHFITRSATVNALGNPRALGITYKYVNKYIFANQGIFAENKYNNQIAGSQGVAVGGRYLGIPVNNENLTAHVGASVRYAKINTGEIDKANQILKTNLHVATALENQVDKNNAFLNANIPWANEWYKFGFEGLVKTDKFFARGEYSFDKINKERPDQKLFEAQLGGLWSWTTLESWQSGNPLDNTNFDGGYIELGYLLKGNKYTYNKEDGLLNGISDKGSVELVARYSYTNLNDIKNGDVFLKGKNKFYPDGVITDYPNESTSIAGGKLHSATLGVNYVFNKYAKVMCAYTYSNLDNPYFPNDKNFNIVQARFMFSF